MLKRFKCFADGLRGSAAVISMSAADVGKLRAFADEATDAEIIRQLASKPFVKLPAGTLCELIDALLAKHIAPPPAPVLDSAAEKPAKKKAAEKPAKKKAAEKPAKTNEGEKEGGGDGEKT